MSNNIGLIKTIFIHPNKGGGNQFNLRYITKHVLDKLVRIFIHPVILRTAFCTQDAYCRTYANSSNVVYIIFVLFDNKIQAPIDVHFKEKMCQK